MSEDHGLIGRTFGPFNFAHYKDPDAAARVWEEYSELTDSADAVDAYSEATDSLHLDVLLNRIADDMKFDRQKRCYISSIHMELDSEEDPRYDSGLRHLEEIAA